MSDSQPDREQYPRLLDWLRYFCAFMLYMYGTSKLLHFQFNLQSELALQPIGSLNGYQLTWYYFGVSRVYACILGLTQVAGATLLLFRKTTLMGALLMLPVMANILLINIFILVDDYGPYVVSTLICISLLVVLWHQRIGLLTLLWSTQNGEPERSKRTHWWIRSSIVLIAAAIMMVAVLHRARDSRLQTHLSGGITHGGH
jgi:hypothetical protein